MLVRVDSQNDTSPLYKTNPGAFYIETFIKEKHQDILVFVFKSLFYIIIITLFFPVKETSKFLKMLFLVFQPLGLILK